MAHWKHAATRCAMPECDRTRRKGWTTCALIGHYERGVSLYGLKPGDARLTLPAPDWYGSDDPHARAAVEQHVNSLFDKPRDRM